MKFQIPETQAPSGMSAAVAIQEQVLRLMRHAGETAELVRMLLRLQSSTDPGQRVSARLAEQFAMALYSKIRSMERLAAYAHPGKRLDTEAVQVTLAGKSYVDRLVNLCVLEAQVLGGIANLLNQNKVDLADLNSLCVVLISQAREVGMQRVPLQEHKEETDASA